MEEANEMEEIEKEKKPRLPLVDKVLAAIMAAIAAIMFMQVFFRYVLNNSLTWGEEVVRFLFIWLVFWGTALNIRDKWNIGVDFLADLLPKRYTRLFQFLDLFSMFIFLLFLAAGGFIWMYSSRGAYSSALGLPLDVVLYGALPVTSALGCYYCFLRWKAMVRRADKEGGRA